MVLRRKWRGYTVVLGGVLIHLTLGTIYTFGRCTLALQIASFFFQSNVTAQRERERERERVAWLTKRANWLLTQNIN